MKPEESLYEEFCRHLDKAKRFGFVDVVITKGGRKRYEVTERGSRDPHLRLMVLAVDEIIFALEGCNYA